MTIEIPVTPHSLPDIHRRVDELPTNGVASVILVAATTKPTTQQKRGFKWWCRVSAEKQGLSFEDAVVDGQIVWGLHTQWKKKYLAIQMYDQPLNKAQVNWREKLNAIDTPETQGMHDMLWLSTSTTWVTKAQWKQAMDWISKDHIAMEIPLPILDPEKSKFK